jgi:Zn-dependent protease
MKGFGMNPKAPLFIPGVGAFVTMREKPSSLAQEASIGLAGPLWGLGSCTALLIVLHFTGHGLVRALVHTGAWINLFNLTPVWQLDGSRGFKAVSKNVRWAIVTLTFALWLRTQEGLLLLLLVVAAWRTLNEDAPERNDSRAALIYAGLLISLTLLAQYTGAPSIQGLH